MRPADYIARIRELEAQLAAANADPNDYELPPLTGGTKSETHPLGTKARIDYLCAALVESRQLVSDHDSDDAKIRTLLAEFDTPQPDGELMTVQLVERAAEALKQARAQLADAQRAAENSKADTQMYHDAWLRELGGKLIPKTHRIDALVLTTQLLVKDRDVLAETVRSLQGQMWDLKGTPRITPDTIAALDRAGGGA